MTLAPPLRPIILRPVMASTPPKRALRRELLERIRRDLLARVLAPHALFLHARKIPLDALAASAQDDHTLVSALFELLTSDDPTVPADLVDAVLAIDLVANGAGHEQLRRLDTEKKLPQERLGDETLAAAAWLDARAVFDQVRIVAKPTAAAAYTEYEAATRAPLPRERAPWLSLEGYLGARMKERGRDAFCESHLTNLGRESQIEFIFGKLPGTHEQLDTSLTRTLVTQTLTHRLLAFVDHGSCRLGAQGFVFQREIVRVGMGIHLFGNADHYAAAAIYSLDGLRDLDTALSCEGLSRIVAIELREIWLRRADGHVTMHRATEKTDLRLTSCARDLREVIAGGGAVEHAKLCLTLAEGAAPGKRGRTVTIEIEPPGKLHMARGDDDVVEIVREMLALRGFMRLPEHAREAAVTSSS